MAWQTEESFSLINLDWGIDAKVAKNGIHTQPHVSLDTGWTKKRINIIGISFLLQIVCLRMLLILLFLLLALLKYREYFIVNFF